MKRVPFAPEGWIFVIPVTIFAAAALLVQWYVAAIVFGAISAFLLHFFRDPARHASATPVDVLSPADGTIIEIREIPDGEVWPGLTRQVSIMMSIFDVHVNRSPITGRVIHYRYNRVDASSSSFGKGSSNVEQTLVVIEGESMSVAFRQLAGLLARRVVFDRKEGDMIARGDRVGMIKFGSRVDLFLPQEANVKVQLHQKVKVGLSVIAELRSAS